MLRGPTGPTHGSVGALPGGTYLPATITEFGNFAAGNFSEFTDSSANGQTGVDYGARVVAADINGGYKCRIKCEYGVSPVYYSDTANTRVHLLGNTAIGTLLTQGNRIYRALSYRWVTNTPLTIYAGDEIHSSGASALANGPAPYNGFGIDGGSTPKKLFRVRGSNDLSASPSFNQWTFGSSPQPSDNGGNRQSQNFAGLTDTATQDEWIHTFLELYLDYAAGEFKLKAAAHGNTAVQIVNKTGIGTCYGLNPASISHYPMMSMYYSNTTGIHTLEYMGGAYGSDLYSLQSWQNQRLAYAFHPGV